MTEDQVLARLRMAFPDGVIYDEEYQKKLGVPTTRMIHRLFRASGQTRIQWLAARGYTWKETGYVEPDMLLQDVEIPTEPQDAFSLADGVFRKYPLAGEYVLSDREAQLLYQSASQTVQKLLLGDRGITVREDIVLVLETIELLKCWSNDLPKEEENISFWDYIFYSMGFSPTTPKQLEIGYINTSAMPYRKRWSAAISDSSPRPRKLSDIILPSSSMPWHHGKVLMGCLIFFLIFM